MPRASDRLPGRGTTVDQPPDDLLEVERVPLGALEDLVVDGSGEVVDAQQQPYEPIGLVARQRIQCDRRHVPSPAAPTGALRCQVRPRRTEEDDRALDVLRELVEEIQEHGVGPMDVLDDDDDGNALPECGEERPPRGMELVADLTRVGVSEGHLRVLESHRVREGGR
jgi:hypothetical protein